jgi:hypothetical protein
LGIAVHALPTSDLLAVEHKCVASVDDFEGAAGRSKNELREFVSCPFLVSGHLQKAGDFVRWSGPIGRIVLSLGR